MQALVKTPAAGLRFVAEIATGRAATPAPCSRRDLAHSADAVFAAR